MSLHAVAFIRGFLRFLTVGDGKEALTRVDERFQMLQVVEMRRSDAAEAPNGAEESAGDDARRRTPTTVETSASHQLKDDKGEIISCTLDRGTSPLHRPRTTRVQNSL